MTSTIDTAESTPRRRERIVKTLGKMGLILGICLNTLVLLPAVAASAWTGHWTASVVGVVLSILVWTAGLQGLKAWAAHLRRGRGREIEDRT